MPTPVPLPKEPPALKDTRLRNRTEWREVRDSAESTIGAVNGEQGSTSHFTQAVFEKGETMPENKSSKGSRIGSLPSSGLGWTSAVLLLLSVVLFFVPAAQPWGLTAALLLALVTGILALMAKKERSWVVWLAVGLPALLLGFEVLTMIIGGEH